MIVNVKTNLVSTSTSVGNETGTRSELRDHAPAFRTLILTRSASDTTASHVIIM